MPARRAIRRLRCWPIGVILAAAIALVGAPALAAAPPYVVSGVPVDVTAADAAAARDQAIVEGQRQAFGMLMEQLLGPEQAAAIPTPSDAELSRMVQDFEVESERVSSVRYIGLMTFRFDAESVDALIGRPVEPGVGVITDTVPVGPVSRLSVVVPITSLRDWTEVRRRLSSIPAVQRAEVRAFARSAGELDLLYFGDEAQLQQTLAQRQLSLLRGPQEWVLQLSEY
jgi:hypothetical protein